MVMSLVMLDEPISLKEYSAGLFISNEGELCVKTEYGNESYIVSSGERFWVELIMIESWESCKFILVFVKMVRQIYYLKLLI